MTLPTLCPRALTSPPLTVNVGHPYPVTIRSPRARLQAVILIVAGVAGSGKTSVGALLAGRLRWRFADADTFHPEANVAKMRAGIPLTDEDRAPWLRAIGDWMDARIAAGRSAVVTCSALKRAYRDQLLSGHEHFFPEKLLDSQLAALEPPERDERVYTVLAEGEPAQTVATIIGLLWPDGEPGPEGPPVSGAP